MSATEWKDKGNAALKGGNTTEAIECYGKAIELDGTNHVFYSNRSAAYLKEGNVAAALADGEKCIEVKPDWAKGYNRKGAAQHAAGDLAQAVETFDKGLEIEPANAALLEAKKEAEGAEARASMPGGGMGGMGAAMASAFGPDMIAKLGANPKTAPYLSDPAFVAKLQAVQANPSSLGELLQGGQSDPRMMECLATLLGMGGGMGGPPGDGDAGGAPASAPAAAPAAAPVPLNETEEEKALRLKKEEALAHKKKGNEAYKKRSFDEALSHYSSAIETDPEDMTFLSNRAAVHLEMKNYDLCVEDCKAAVTVGRAARADYAVVAKAFVRIGNALKKKGDLPGAIEAYESAQMENFDKKIKTTIKDTTRALKKLADAAYISPEEALKAKERGNEHFKAQRWKEAIHEYDDAVKRDPKNATLYCNRAAAQMKVMDFVPARNDCEKALELDPKYVKAWSRLGAIQFFMKEYHKALDSYQKGLNFDETSAECKDGLRRTMAAVNSGAGSEQDDKERAAHAMADPEIQAILGDPVINRVLQDMQEDPKKAQEHMQDAFIMGKINKLIAAGILKVK